MLLLAFPDFESIEYLLSQTQIINVETYQNIRIFTLNYKGIEFLAEICGYGKVNIGRAINHAFENYELSSILGVCTAGSLDTRRHGLLTAVVPEIAFQFDVDLTSLGYPCTTFPDMPTGFYEADREMLSLAKGAAVEENVVCRSGRVATADKFLCDNYLRALLREKYCTTAVDMECGSIGEAAFLADIPFAGIKVICNDAGNEAVTQYNMYSKEALLISQKIALKYVQMM